MTKSAFFKHSHDSKNMKSKIRKAVIPAAGLGTRFLPATKTLPKELLPILNIPVLQMVVQEAVKSGIEEILLIVSPHKPDLSSHFRHDRYYEAQLEAKNKSDSLSELNHLMEKVTIRPILQTEPKGLGHAIWVAKKEVGEEPFLVLLPDILIDHPVPCSRQLIEAFNKKRTSINATMHIPKNGIQLFGIYDIASSEGRFHKAKRVVEKPKANEAPSDFAVIGRYLFLPEIFSVLEKTPAGKNGEIQLADAMSTLASEEKLYAYEFEGKHFDTGDVLGFLKANLHYGLKRFSKEEIWNF